MNKNLETFIKSIEKQKSVKVIRISKEVSPVFEIPAIVEAFERGNEFPILIFEKVRNLKGRIAETPVIINLFANRDGLAYAINSTAEGLSRDYIKKEKPVPPLIIPKNQAPVKDVIQTVDRIDLLEFPVITHHEMDLGPYITGGSAWIRDFETDFVNCAIIRVYVAGKNKLLVNFNKARHGNFIFEKYKSAGKPMPMVLVIGHHPAFYMGAQTKLYTDEPQIIGGVMEEPLELTPSETWGADMMVPAHAEIVIEAEVSVTEKEAEAPFGEYTGYYGRQKLNPVAAVTAVTRKKEAYYLDIMPGHADHFLLDTPMAEANLFNKIQESVPGVLQVHMPASAGSRLHAYVQIRKSNDGEPKTAIAAAISSDYRIKHVVVVDEDVDIFDERQILWAIATRSQWHKDLVIIPGMMGASLDPSADGLITTKGGIDATKPIGNNNYPSRISIPKSVSDRINLKDYLENDKEIKI